MFMTASNQGEKPGSIDKLAFSITDIANRLGLSERTIHRLVANGSLRSIKAGRRRLIPRDSLRELLNGTAG
jgi:excisionase family DNA binding protein